MPSRQPPARSSALRKLIHVAGTTLPAAGWLLSYGIALGLAGGLLAASLAVELARRACPTVNGILWRLLPAVFRDGEEQRILGSTWLAAGALSTLLAFGVDVGGTALLFLMWGDPAAELAGRRWGPPDQRKTHAGSLGCLIACLLAGAVGIYAGGLRPGAVLAGALVAVAVERRSPLPDDNVWIPVLSGLVIWAIQAWLSA
jgi:dolichol kinase